MTPLFTCQDKEGKVLIEKDGDRRYPVHPDYLDSFTVGVDYGEGKDFKIENTSPCGDDDCHSDKCCLPMALALPVTKAKEQEDSIFGLNNPFPLKAVLEKLVTGTEILLTKKSYDGPDYEEMEICVKRGKEIIQSLTGK